MALDPRDGSVLREVAADVQLDYVTGIATSADGGDLWISHMRGLSHYDGTRWVTLTGADGLPGGRALAVLVASDSSVWVGTEQGVARCQQEGCRGYTTEDGLVTTGCAYLFEDSRSQIW